MPEQNDARRCDHCGYPLRLVHVHGHAQCAHCKINVEPCCQGGEACATAEPPGRHGPQNSARTASHGR